MKKFFFPLLAAVVLASCTKETVYVYDFIVVNETNKTINVTYEWRGQEISETIPPFNQAGISNSRHTVNTEIPMATSEVQSDYLCRAWSTDSSYQADLTDLSNYIYTTSSEQMGGHQTIVQSKYVHVIK